MLDIMFEGPIQYAYRDVAASIETVPYVAAHGLYLDKVHSVVAIGDAGYRTIAPYLKVRAWFMTQVEKRWPESSYFLLSREEQQASGVRLKRAASL